MPAEDEQPQVFNPPNRLKMKLGGRLKGFDAEAIARAEAAIANMSSNFEEWLHDELNKLLEAHKVILNPAHTVKDIEAFYRTAHDLKGLGTTYGYPIVSQFAASLCRLIDSPEGRDKAPIELLTAHVEAINASVRQRIKLDTHPIGHELLKELTKRVAVYGEPE